MIFLKAILVWLIFIMAESLNGMIRLFWLIPSLGEGFAHPISFLLGSGLVLGTAILFIDWLHASRIAQLWKIGFLWLCLTLGFEISLGRFVFGYFWAEIAADYNLLQGRLMLLGLGLLLLAPLIAAKLQGVLPKEKQPT